MVDFSVHNMLREHPYFARLPHPALDGLVQTALRRTFLANEIIFQEGAASAGLWLLENGRVKAFKLSPDGQEYVMNFFAPGSTFNDLAALDGAANPVSTMAVTDVVAWVIPTAVFVDALQQDHAMCQAVLYGLIGRVRHLVGRVEDLALRPVTARLARFLLQQIEEPSLADPAITRALIAQHLATTPESISRSLRILEEAGAIRFDRHQILVTNPAALEQQALL